MLINDCGWKDGDSGDSAAKNLLTQTGLLMEGDSASLRPFFAFWQGTPVHMVLDKTDLLGAYSTVLDNVL
jgi:hypothetical protein